MLLKAPSSPWSRGLLLLLLVFVLYGPGLGNGFTLDDHPYLEKNARLRSIEGIGYLFFHPLEEGDTLRAHLYRPMAALVEAGVGGSFGFEPKVFHVASIVLYAGLGWLLFALLQRLFSPTLAWVATLLFLVHPVHTEAVASAVGITELLAGLFTLAALERLLPKEGIPSFGRQVAAGFLFLAGLLSKETVALLPLLALLAFWQRGLSWREIGKVLALLALPAGIYFALRYHVVGSLLKAEQIQIALLDNPLVALSPLDRFANGAVLLLRSLSLLLVPWKLSADYSLAALPVVSLAWGGAALVLHLALLGFAVSTRRYNFALFFGLAFFYLGLLPTSNLLFASGTIFGERFLLLPALAHVLPAAHLFERFASRPAKRHVASVALLVLLALFATRTIVRVADWKSDRTLFESALRAYPQNAKMSYDVAVLLQREGKVAEALPLAEKALAIYPDYGDARLLLARLLRGRNEGLRALSLLREGLEQNPLHEDMWVELGEIQLVQGRLDNAAEIFRQGLQKLPASLKLANNLAMVELERGHPEAAEPLLQKVLARVDWPDAHYARGFIQLERGEYAAAAKSLERALGSPRWGQDARYRAALAKVLLGDNEGALTLLEEAQPGTENALLAAVALGRVGEGQESRQILKELGLEDPAHCPPEKEAIGQLCRDLLSKTAIR